MENKGRLGAYLLSKRCLDTGRRAEMCCLSSEDISRSSSSSSSSSAFEELQSYFEHRFPVSDPKMLKECEEVSSCNCSFDVSLQLHEITVTDLYPSKAPGKVRNPFCRVSTSDREPSQYSSVAASLANISQRKETESSSSFQTEVQHSTLNPKWYNISQSITISSPMKSGRGLRQFLQPRKHQSASPVSIGAANYLTVDVCDDQGQKSKTLGRVVVPLVGVSTMEGVVQSVSLPLPLHKGNPSGSVQLKYSLLVHMNDVPPMAAVRTYSKLLQMLSSKTSGFNISPSASLASFKTANFLPVPITMRSRSATLESKMSFYSCSSSSSSSSSSSPSFSSFLSYSSPSIYDNLSSGKPVLPGQRFAKQCRSGGPPLDESASQILSIVARFCGISKLHQSLVLFNHAVGNHWVYDERTVDCLSTIVDGCVQWEDSMKRKSFRFANELQKWERDQIFELMDNCEVLVTEVKAVLALDPGVMTTWDSDHVQALGLDLRLMKLICGCELIQDSLLKDEQDLGADLDAAAVVTHLLKKTLTSWCQRMFMTIQGGSVSDWFHCQKSINDSVVKVLELLQGTFEEIGVNFFEVVYSVVDKEIGQVLPAWQFKMNENLDQALNLYVSLKFFKQLPSMFHEEDVARSHMCINGYHNYFNVFVPKWIAARTCKLCQVVQQASETLQEEPVAEEELFSINGRDTVDFIVMVCHFLDRVLQWPDPEGFKEQIKLLTKSFSSVVPLFVTSLEKTVQAECISAASQAQSTFYVTPKLCIALCDMEHVRLSVQAGVLKDYFPWFCSTVADQGSDFFEGPELEPFVGDLDQRIVNVQASLIESIVVKMIPVLAEGLKVAPKLKEPFKDVSNGFVGYLRANVLVCAERLHSRLFSMFLSALWRGLLPILSANMPKLPKLNPSSAVHYSDILKVVEDLLMAEERGLSRAELESEEYWVLHSSLQLQTLREEELIQVYLQELLAAQEEASSSGGLQKGAELVLTAGYSQGSRTIDVNLIRARGLSTPKSSQKSCNPYLKLTALPGERFPCFDRTKSKPYPPSTDPVLDWNVSIPSLEMPGSLQGCAVVVEVFSHSPAKAHCPIGVAVLACAGMPVVGRTAGGGLRGNCNCMADGGGEGDSNGVLAGSLRSGNQIAKRYNLSLFSPPRSLVFKEMNQRRNLESFVKRMAKFMQ